MSRPRSRSAPHLSFYHLTLSQNTLFSYPPAARRRRRRDIESGQRAGSRAGTGNDLGLRPGGRECRHMQLLQSRLSRHRPAHSKLSLPDRVLRQVRWKQRSSTWKPSRAARPLQDDPRWGRTTSLQFMLNALRLTDGVAARRRQAPISAVIMGASWPSGRPACSTRSGNAAATALGQRSSRPAGHFPEDDARAAAARPRSGTRAPRTRTAPGRRQPHGMNTMTMHRSRADAGGRRGDPAGTLTARAAAGSSPHQSTDAAI